jgi:hypothetical protein
MPRKARIDLCGVASAKTYLCGVASAKTYLCGIALGINQGQLASAMGVSRKTVNELCTGNDLSAKKAAEYKIIQSHMTELQSLRFWLSIIVAIINSAGLIIGFWASYIVGTKF